MDINQLYGTTKIVLLYLASIFFAAYARRICSKKYLRFTLIDLKNDLFNGLIHEDISTFMQNNSALYISILNNDLKAIEDDYFDNFFNIVSNICAYVIALAFMFYLNPIIALASIILSILPLLISSVFAKKLASLRENYMASLERYNVKIKDFFTGFEIIKSSIMVAGLSEFVQTLDEGLQTQIDDNGRNFSGGERQRIAIARAIATGSEVIILDEATANLDNKIAFDIEKSILEADDLTSIVITHRLNRELLMSYDEVFVFKNGALSE